MQAIVLADGEVGTRPGLDAAWPGWLEPSRFVVAADGGARHAGSLGISIDRWVGDADSIDPDDLAGLAAAGIPIQLVPADKDESDTELALRVALEAGPESVIVLGALGGRRLDHALANLTLLAHPDLAGRPLTILATDARVRLLDAAGRAGPATRLELSGRIGDLVTLLPVGGDALGVTTEGLRYPLEGEPIREGQTRGLSNVRIAARATVTIGSGRLLVIETPATLPP
jgi:thiamine pyrophosphokinase